MRSSRIGGVAALGLVSSIVPSAAIGTPPLYVQGISVSSKSKNLPLALAFAEHLTNSQN